MDAEQIFNSPFKGWLEVTIEELGTMKIQAIGEPIVMLISNIESALSNKIVICHSDLPPPYDLISFDGKKIVVRKKSSQR